MGPSKRKTFADRLRELRETAGLSQDRLGQLSGISKRDIVGLESGETQPSWAAVQALAHGLGVEVGSFVIKTDPPDRSAKKPKIDSPANQPRGKRAKERSTTDRRRLPPHHKGVIGDRRGTE